MDVTPDSDARRRYLATAAEIARGEAGRLAGAAHLAAAIPLAELAERVGVSRSALYKMWPSQGELWADLVAYVNFARDYPRSVEQMGVSPLPTEFTQIDLTEPTWIEAIRQQTNEAAVTAAADPTRVLRAAVLTYPEEVESAAARQSVEAFRFGMLARRISVALARGRRDFPGPFGIRHLTEATWAAIDGLVVTGHWRAGLVLDTVSSDDGLGAKPWLLGAWVYRALAFETTAVGRPIEWFAPEPAPIEMPTWSERRQAVLASGVEALLDNISAPKRDTALAVLPHITIDRIARATHVSRRAVYDVWDGRDTMLLDLLDELLDAEYRHHTSRLEAIWPPDRPPVLDAEAIGRAFFAPSSKELALEIAVSAYLPESRRPDVRRVLLDHHERSVDYVAGQLARLAQPPELLTLDQHAEVLLALLNGMRRVRRVHGDTGWSGDLAVTFGTAVVALCRHNRIAPKGTPAPCRRS